MLALVAAVFGVATVAAGVRVLAGHDPGYVVFRPLLLFNVAMGLGYLATGIVIWRSLERGTATAAAIVGLNLLVLGGVVYLYAAGRAIAVDSVRAMVFRTVVWLVLLAGLAWLARQRR